MRWPAVLALLAAVGLLGGTAYRPGAGLTLQARAGVLGGTPPGNMPRGPVAVPLPLYPEAVPYRGTVPGGPFSFSVPSVLYLKAATASYLIPVNWSVAKTCYDTHMAAAGYSSTGSGGAASESLRSPGQ